MQKSRVVEQVQKNLRGSEVEALKSRNFSAVINQ